MKNFIIKVLYALKSPLLSLLEQEVIKALLARIVITFVPGSYVTWVITFIVEKLGEYVARPIINAFFRKVGYAYEVIDGTHLLRKIQNATDINDYRVDVHSV